MMRICGGRVCFVDASREQPSQARKRVRRELVRRKRVRRKLAPRKRVHLRLKLLILVR